MAQQRMWENSGKEWADAFSGSAEMETSLGPGNKFQDSWILSGKRETGRERWRARQRQRQKRGKRLIKGQGLVVGPHMRLPWVYLAPYYLGGSNGEAIPDTWHYHRRQVGTAGRGAPGQVL